MPSLQTTNVRKMPPLSVSSDGWGSLESCEGEREREGEQREREREGGEREREGEGEKGKNSVRKQTK